MVHASIDGTYSSVVDYIANSFEMLSLNVCIHVFHIDCNYIAIVSLDIRSIKKEREKDAAVLNLHRLKRVVPCFASLGTALIGAAIKSNH